MILDRAVVGVFDVHVLNAQQSMFLVNASIGEATEDERADCVGAKQDATCIKQALMRITCAFMVRWN